VFFRIGWMMRGILLGAKVDECPRCDVVGPHLLVRKSYWYTVFSLPLVLLWLKHGLLCPNCEHWTPLSYPATRAALRSERLRLQRERPNLLAALRGGEDAAPEDWEALGVHPGASTDAVQASYRRLAKQVHPDRGGSDHAFADLSGAYQRVTSTLHGGSTPVSAEEVAAVVDPVMVNPNRGIFDVYLKAWPVLAAIVLAIALANSSSSSASTYPNGGNYDYSTPTGQTHTCWTSAGTINGCQSSSGGWLFGSQTGTLTTCYFDEPLLPGASAKCR
jgi:hypothetical protein